SERVAELRSCTNLIIDLRKNEGGTESGFVPLLPLVLDRPMPFAEAMADEPIETNYTKANCERRITEFRAIKAMCAENGDKTAAGLCEDLIREFRENSGSGLCREESASAGESDLLQPYANIKKVILITDTWCRDAGEVFVKLAAKSSKVTVLGRPTMGTIDYTNSVTMLLDQTFVLSYPMSRRGHVTDGICYNDTGLPVDVYVPWTPQECTQDLLLAKALELL
ncbi:MAG: S41 family peptidase, partial [Lachnospiraceae bacterium]|nr:S41 family peptidase [Lachnospiraceae bacterium]